uniref:Uncharacterized protein n=1 Tax=Zelopaecilomyces penicillatus TaxID=264952 RepID=A0A4Y6A5T5_9HYPO|nr:hypothetical protein [Zelopaecilomyces penicillatus]QDE53010.1 hypothetical protein [Zelopaecilomyces penicillatus]
MKYKIKILKIFTFNISVVPSPHKFNNVALQSTIVELTEITTKLDELLPQFSNFIEQFNHLIISTNVNVISDVNGDLSLDVPASMPDSEAEKISKKVGILDRLIGTRSQEIDKLVQKGLIMESKLKEENPNFTSQILDKVNEFKKLNSSYKH